MRHVRVVATLVAFLATPLHAAAQAPANERPDPVALVGQAEKLIAQKEVEDAILLLWRALDELATRARNPVHDATTLSARFLLDAHDPREAERRRVFAAIAKQQLELAAAYRAKKWFAVAATRIDVAERFDRDAADKERALLVAAKAKAPAAPDAKPAPAAPAAASAMRRSDAAFIAGEWRDFEGGVESPARTASASLSEWVTKTSHADHEIVVEFQPADAKVAHDGALAVGLSILPGTTNFSGVRVYCIYQPEHKEYCVQVIAIQAQQTQELGRAWIAPPATEDGWQRLAVRVRENTVQVVLGPNAAVQCTAPQPLRGQIGLVTGLRNTPSCAVRFRNLRVEPLPADAPSDEELRAAAEAATQNAITKAVDAAKEALTKKQPEAATLSLREALGHVDDLSPGVLRDNLRKSVETMLTQADPLTPRRVKAAQTIAAELGALADAYAAAGLARAALVRAEAAAAFDAAGQAARLAACREKVQQWNLAQATARAAELQPPADDGTVLREWFGKGRKLDTAGPGFVIDGASARVAALGQNDLATWLPHPLAAPIAKASVHARLPVTGSSAGLCVDVVDYTNFAIVIVRRGATGLRLEAYRFFGKNWIALSGREIPMDAWRLDAWHPLVVESTEAGGIVARCGATELKVARSQLGKATGLFGLYAENSHRDAITIELRAFRLLP